MIKSFEVNGTSETKTKKFVSRSVQQSVRFHTLMLWIVCTFSRSTCHHGWFSCAVCVTEPLKKLPSVFPSTARLAAPPKSVLDWVAGRLLLKLAGPRTCPLIANVFRVAVKFADWLPVRLLKVWLGGVKVKLGFESVTV